ncbi:MAG: flagellar motor switch protein FliN [Treponema sp.]|jgi:flagellar motor switch protein FliN/FliY|nr:flagellar motor switch protein FliN [Treponema sp.]
MSDGALSQAEIDALLSGVDSSSMGGHAPAATLSGNEEERKTLQNLLVETDENQGRALSTMTGTTVAFNGPEVSFSSRDSLLEQLPDQVSAVKVDFSAGFPGEHVFIMGEDTAKCIASLLNKEDNITLDEMALSVIGEVVSQLVGTQITALTKATNNTSVASVPPEATNVPKAVVALPNGTFPVALYNIDFGDGIQRQLWEVYGAAVLSNITKAIKSATAAKKTPSPQPAAATMPNMGGMPGSMPMQSYPMMGYPMPGMGGPTYIPPNVQSVQFPNLLPQNAAMEHGNIGLIMDVFMEMTVELGRTKKLIKEILSMGEGTIIELDKLAGEPVDILVNHKLIAKGEVVVIDENFGVRVTEIVSPAARVNGGK